MSSPLHRDAMSRFTTITDFPEDDVLKPSRPFAKQERKAGDFKPLQTGRSDDKLGAWSTKRSLLLPVIDEATGGEATFGLSSIFPWATLDTNAGFNATVPASSVALIVQHFTTALEELFPISLDCSPQSFPQYRRQFADSLCYVLRSYLGPAGPLRNDIEPGFFGDVLLKIVPQLAEALVLRSLDPRSCLDLDRTHNLDVTVRIREKYVASYDELVLFRGLFSDLEPEKGVRLTTRRGFEPPKDSFEPTLFSKFASLYLQQSFRDLALECHASWYSLSAKYRLETWSQKVQYRLEQDKLRPRGRRMVLKSCWDPVALAKHLVSIGERPELQRLLVLTGSSLITDAQPCIDYANCFWPGIGAEILRNIEGAVKKALDRSLKEDRVILEGSWGRSEVEGKVQALSSACKVRVDLATEPQIQLFLKGPVESAGQVVQVFLWLAAALRLPRQTKVPELADVSLEEVLDGFLIRSVSVPIGGSPEHLCWTGMLDQSVIANGFPILHRGPERGLCMSLRTGCAIIGASQLIECAGGPVIKGMSGLLVPVRKFWSGLQFHLILPDPKKPYVSTLRLLKDFPQRLTRQNTRLADLNGIIEGLFKSEHGCFIGWHPKAVCRAGRLSTNDDYTKIRKSGLSALPQQQFRLKSIALGFQQFATAQVEIEAVPFQSTLYYSRKAFWFDDMVLRSTRGRVLLYDTLAKRGWLISTTDVVLHMIRRRLVHHPSIHIPDGRDAAETLKNSASKKLDADLTFRDLIKENLDTIERLEAELSTFDSASWRSKGKLFGYEFLSAAEQGSLFQLREASIDGRKPGRSWVDLVHASDTLVLFGSGFGDIIGLEEREKTQICPMWRSVPCNLGLMTAMSTTLQHLYDEEPAETEGQVRCLTHLKLEWDQGSSKLFEPCQQPFDTCCCQRVHMLRSRGPFSMIVPPSSVPATGAVIFGDPVLLQRAPRDKSQPTNFVQRLSLAWKKVGGRENGAQHTTSSQGSGDSRVMPSIARPQALSRPTPVASVVAQAR